MKCDICGCKISRRDKVCPNCGYTIRKDGPTIVSTPKVKETNTIKKKIYNNKGISGKVILFLTALLILGIIIFSPENIEDMSFEDIVEEHRDDDYGTVQTAIIDRDRMINHLYNSGFVYFKINEDVYVNDDEMTAVSHIDISKPESTIPTAEIVLKHKNGECIQCYLEDDCELGQFPPNDINDYNKLLGYENLLKELEVVKGPFVQRYEYSDDLISLYVLESAVGSDIHYKISFDGTKMDSNIYD